MRNCYYRTSRRNYDPRRLAGFLMSAREEHNIDGPTLAERAGIQEERLFLAEAGKARLTDAELSRLAAGLSVSETLLLEEAGLLTHVHVRRNAPVHNGP